MLDKIFGQADAGLPANISAVVTLARPTFTIGDEVQGQLTITVGGSDAFKCEGITVALVGVEQLKWDVKENESWDNREAHHRFVPQEVRLPVSLKAPVPIGNHVFPFAFPLAANLPASHTQIEPHDQIWRNVESRVEYFVEASMILKGQKKPHIVSQPVTLQAVPLLSMPPCRPVHDTHSMRVKSFCCFEKGTCEVSATMEADAVDLTTGVINVKTTVLNGTTLAILGIHFSLYNALNLQVPSGCGSSGSCRILRALHTKNFNEVIAAGTKKEHIPVQFALPEVTAALLPCKGRVPRNAASPASPDLRPTGELVFSSNSYYVEVKVLFASSLCSDVKLQLPVVLRLFPTTQDPILDAIVPTMATGTG